MKVVLDTSFIIACGQRKKDYLREVELAFGRVEFLVPSAVVRELDLLSGRKDVRLSRQMLERHPYGTVACDGPADDCVLSVAESEGGAVASFDSKLRKRARMRGLKVVTVRKGEYVMDSHY